MSEFREIRDRQDVTDDHVEEAADMREGMYGGERLDWDDIIDKLERNSGEDWGSEATSPAIIELKRRVRALLRERA